MKQVGNTILAKGVNHILAKRDNSAWPKGAKLSGFSISKERRVLRKDDGCLVLRHRPCQAMGRNDSLHRAKPPCSLDAQQDHPEGHRELQNHSRAEGIYADIEDKIKGKIWKTNNLTFSFPVFRTKLPHLAIFVVVLY